jgi:hypothetical protein
MLSQNPIDLPKDASHLKSKARASDTATWVRQTHVDRLALLVRRVTEMKGHTAFLASNLYMTSLEIARAHQQWPWEWSGVWISQAHHRALAAMLAVADLLDEDAARCDTITLLQHREGNELNKAHWLRHSLTTNRVLVQKGRLEVSMVKPPNTTRALRPVFSALRNHFRLVELYNSDLREIQADISNIVFRPDTGIPIDDDADLDNWQLIAGFTNEQVLCSQLLRTFMPLALKDSRRCDEDSLRKLRVASLEDVDLDVLEMCEGGCEPRTGIEQTFHAILGQ